MEIYTDSLSRFRGCASSDRSRCRFVPGAEYDERAAHNIKSIAVDFESMFYSPVGGAGCSYLPQ